MKKLVSMVLIMSMLFMILPNTINAQSKVIAINNLTVTNDAGEAVNTANGSGTWKWMAKSKTLQLTDINAVFEGIVFSLPAGSIIETEGIIIINNKTGNTSIYCAGDLTIRDKKANNTDFLIDGISIDGDLTVEGNSYLEIGDRETMSTACIVATNVFIKESLLNTYGSIITSNGASVDPTLFNSIWTNFSTTEVKTILEGKPLIKTPYTSSNLKIPSGAILTIAKTGKLNIVGAMTLEVNAQIINNGVIYVDDSIEIINNGIITNNGLFEGKIDISSTGSTTGIMKAVDSVNLNGMETSDKMQTEGWSWDKSTKTLAVKGANIDKLGIVAGDFNLIAEGKNKIKNIARATGTEGGDNTDIVDAINLNIKGSNDAIIEFDEINLGNEDSIYAQDVFLCVSDNNIKTMSNTIMGGNIKLERTRVLAAKIIADATLTLNYARIEIEVVTEPSGIAVIANKIILNNTQIKEPINATIGTIKIAEADKESFVVNGIGQNKIITISDKETVAIEGISISDQEYSGTQISYTGTPIAKKRSGETVEADISEPFWYKYIDNQARIIYSAPTDVGKYALEFMIDNSSMLYKGVSRFDFEIKQASLGDLAKIEGNPALGEVLTATVGDLPDDFGTANYVWTRDNKEIANATALTYTIVAEDIGKSLQFIVKSPLGNYVDIKSNIIVVSGKDPGITKWPTILPIQYGQEIVAAIGNDAETAVAGDFSFENNNFRPEVSTGTYKLIFTADKTGYNTVTKDVEVVVNKADLEIIGEKTYIGKYGQKLKNIAIDLLMCNTNNKNEKVPGEWVWNTPDKSIGEIPSYKATFTPIDKTKYEITEKDIKINVEKADLKCDYRLSNTSAKPGDTVTITINLSNPYDASLKEAIPVASEVKLSCGGTSLEEVQGSNGEYTIQYKIPDNAALGDIEFIIRTDENTRYTEMVKSLILTVTDKELTTVALKASKNNIIYGEKLSLLATVKAGNSSLNIGTVEFSIKDNMSYAPESIDLSNGSAELKLAHDVLNKIGTYTFEVVYNDESGTYSTGKAHESVTIAPKEIVITVKDKKINIGDAIPNSSEFEITVDGLIEGDNLIKQPQIVISNLDNEKAGKYVIEAGAAEAGENYFITYKKGSFEVVDPNAPQVPSGGSYDSEEATPPIAESTTKDGTTTIKKDAIIKDETAMVEISTADIAKMVQNAGADKVNEVVIEPKINGKVAKTEINLPLNSLKSIEKINLVIKNPSIEILLSNEALINMGDKESKILSVKTENINDITKISINIDGKELKKDIEGLKVKIDTEKTGNNFVAFQINEDKKETIITKSFIKDGKMMLSIGNTIELAIKEVNVDFNDIEDNAWCKNAIDFVSSRKILTGITPTTFDINSKMTRAMLVTSLGRLENIDKEAQDIAKSMFKDIDTNLYYAPYTAWASENKIVMGKDNMFVPHDNITREELSTILYRYLLSINKVDKNISGEAFDGYQDKNQASEWSIEAMTYLVEKGILTGKEDMLDPKGLAGRGEVATMLMRIIIL